MMMKRLKPCLIRLSTASRWTFTIVSAPQRDAAGETHVVWGLPNHQYRRNEQVPFLSDQLAALNTVDEISADG